MTAPPPITPPSTPSNAPPDVWIVQGRVEHYRTPIWDRLVERGAGAYRLRVLGRTDGGRPWGGADSRPYIEELPLVYHGRWRLRPLGWPGLADRVRRERPAVIVMNANPRNRDCWTLPDRARQAGAAVLAWSKVHGASRLPRWIAASAKRRLYSRYDGVLVYGLASRRELADLGYPSDRIFLTRNTIDTSLIFEHEDDIRRRAAALRDAEGLADARVLLYVGRMAADKRVTDLLAAWPRLRNLDPGLSLVLAGGGPDLDAIRQAANSTDRDRIHVTGRVPEGDDYAWIAAADVMAQCGAVGLAINQALALGTPAVIADEPGSDTEIIEHGVTGRRYPRGDLDALVAAVEAALVDEAATRTMATAGRRLMRDEVNVDRLAEAIDQAIRFGLELSEKRRSA